MVLVKYNHEYFGNTFLLTKICPDLYIIRVAKKMAQLSDSVEPEM